MQEGCATAPDGKAVRRTQFRTLVALTMLIVASLGAGVAGWAAIKQQASSSLDRRLAQAQTMELSDRLQFTEHSRTASSLQARFDRSLAEARAQRAMAQQQKADDPEQAKLSELKSQETLLLANVMRPLLEFLPNLIAEDHSLDERRLGLVAAGNLQSRGFQGSWTEEDLTSPASTDGQRLAFLEKDRSDRYDDQILGLAMVVIVLVLALVLLTFADLSGKRAAWGYLFYLTALVCGAGGIAAAISIDESLVEIVGGITVAFCLFVVLAYMLGWLSAPVGSTEPLQPQGIDSQGFAGGSLQITDATAGFSRFLVIAIALTALISSLIGYWYSAAGTRADDASYGAYAQQLEVVKRSGRASTAVLGTFDDLVDLYQQRVRCQAAHNQSELARDGRIAVSPQTAAISEHQQCDGLDPAKTTTARAKVLADLDSRYGPQSDPRFPLRLQEQIASSAANAVAAEAMALWDGYGELSAFWNGKTTSFLACLTMVAIALYVFGQALAMVQLKVTRAMTTVGVAMTLGALGWSAYTWLKPFPVGAGQELAGCASLVELENVADHGSPEAAMKVAALNYAIGSQRLKVAETEAEYAAAITALECAVAARPNLALAHHDLAGAKAIIQSAHKNQAFYSLPTRERLDEIETNSRANVEIQKRLGLSPTGYALNSHAVALWGLGIRHGNLEKITAALGLVEQAVAITEALEANRLGVSQDASRNLYPWLSVLPLLYLNESLFLIAHDRVEEAQAAAEKALALGASRDWSMTGIMFTATSLLDVNCERLHTAERCGSIKAALGAYRRALIEGRWAADDEKHAGRVEALTVSVTASDLSFAARINNFDPSKDQLTAIWSIQDPQWGVQDALTAIIPQVSGGELQPLRDQRLSYQRSVLNASGFKRCLLPGRYSVELAVNGRAAAVGTSELRGPAMSAARFEALNLAMCHPTAWTRWTSEDGAWGPEPMAGFVNEKGKPAAFFFTFAMPEAQSDAPETAAYALDRALRLLVTKDVLSGNIEDLREKMQSCSEVGQGGIARAVARAADGHMHVVLVLVDALDGIGACEIVQSVTMMHRASG